MKRRCKDNSRLVERLVKLKFIPVPLKAINIPLQLNRTKLWAKDFQIGWSIWCCGILPQPRTYVSRIRNRCTQCNKANIRSDRSHSLKQLAFLLLIKSKYLMTLRQQPQALHRVTLSRYAPHQSFADMISSCMRRYRNLESITKNSRTMSNSLRWSCHLRVMLSHFSGVVTMRSPLRTFESWA